MTIDARIDPLGAFVEIAESFEGKDFEKDRAELGALVCPEGPAAFVDFFARPNVPGATNSTCGVVARGLLVRALRAIGRSELGGPLPFDWWSPVVALARDAGALRTGREMPVYGAIVYVARTSPATGKLSQHWRTIVKVEGFGRFETIDGGQLDVRGHGFQAVRRNMVTMNGPTVSMTAFDVTAQKPVAQWIDTGTLLRALAPVCRA